MYKSKSKRVKADITVRVRSAYKIFFLSLRPYASPSTKNIPFYVETKYMSESWKLCNSASVARWHQQTSRVRVRLCREYCGLHMQFIVQSNDGVCSASKGVVAVGLSVATDLDKFSEAYPKALIRRGKTAPPPLSVIADTKELRQQDHDVMCSGQSEPCTLEMPPTGTAANAVSTNIKDGSCSRGKLNVVINKQRFSRTPS